MCRIHFANSFFTLVLGEFAPLFYEISYYVLFCICLRSWRPWFRSVFACLTSHDLHTVKRYNNFHVIAKQRCLYNYIISKRSNLVSLTWESCFDHMLTVECLFAVELYVDLRAHFAYASCFCDTRQLISVSALKFSLHRALARLRHFRSISELWFVYVFKPFWLNFAVFNTTFDLSCCVF